MRLSTSEKHTSGLSRRQSVLDTINKESSRQHVSNRKGLKPIKILLLGQEVYPPLTTDHLKLKMQLAPVGQVEAALISKIPPVPSQSDHQEIDGGQKNEIRRVVVLYSAEDVVHSWIKTVDTYKIVLKPYRASTVAESGCTPLPLRLFVHAALLIKHLLNLAEVMQTSIFWGEKRTCWR
ncbi:hypothetical protein EDC04DRAFT_2598789 [Pisolithus marmoratus]|nr:hypothetical protein EDC04DRAFT_2598789 [Pisolithus marmoratus]